MKIKLKINESSSVEVVPCDDCDAIQGECCVTELELEYPATIKGYPIANYAKYIEFAECKEVGQCAKFVDEIDGNIYKLKEPATSFSKIKIQFRFENTIDENSLVLWKSKVFELEFGEAINAEGAAEIQSQLLNLKEIEDDWKNYIKDNTFRVISKSSDVPIANSDNADSVIFYLGETTDSFVYGHYYRCAYANNIYSWTDLTQDPNVGTTADAIRETNNSQAMQIWVGTKEELEAETPQNNVMYIPTDQNFNEAIEELLNEIAIDAKTVNGIEFKKDTNNVLKTSDEIISRKKLIWSGTLSKGKTTSVTLNKSKKYMFIAGAGKKFVYEPLAGSTINDFYVTEINGNCQSTMCLITIVSLNLGYSNGILTNKATYISGITINQTGGTVTSDPISDLGYDITEIYEIIE